METCKFRCRGGHRLTEIALLAAAAAGLLRMSSVRVSVALIPLGLILFDLDFTSLELIAIDRNFMINCARMRKLTIDHERAREA